MLPILYQNRDFILYSYPLLMGIGWGVAYQIYFSLIDQKIPKVKLQILFWGVFLFSWIGAKLFFSFTLPDKNKLLEQINFWIGGGFVFYGGFISAAIYLMVFKYFDKRLTLEHLSPMIPALAFGHAVGRVGCFLAGCCYGAPTDFFWGIHLHDEFRHPTQIMEALGLLVLGFFLLKRKTDFRQKIILYSFFYGILRFFIESLRGDVVRGQWGIMTPSSWISLGMIFVSMIIFLVIRKRS